MDRESGRSNVGNLSSRVALSPDTPVAGAPLLLQLMSMRSGQSQSFHSPLCRTPSSALATAQASSDGGRHGNGCPTLRTTARANSFLHLLYMQSTGIY